MNVKQLMDTLQSTALWVTGITSYAEGDVYENLNSKGQTYPKMVFTLSTIGEDNVTGTIFYIDRLLTDNSNKIDIQSAGVTALNTFKLLLEDAVAELSFESDTKTPFTEQFADMCAGVYSQVTMNIALDLTCSDSASYTDKILSVTENGIYNSAGYNKVDVSVAAYYSQFREDVAYTMELEKKWDPSGTTRTLFRSDGKVKYLPEVDMSNITTAGQMLYGTYNLLYVPPLNLSNCTTFVGMFWHSEVIYVSAIDMSNAVGISEMFRDASELTYVEGFINLGQSFRNAQILDLSPTPRLTNESVQNVIDTVYDMIAGGKSIRPTIRLDRAVYANVTDEQKAQAAAKGWNITT